MKEVQLAKAADSGGNLMVALGLQIVMVFAAFLWKPYAISN